MICPFAHCRKNVEPVGLPTGLQEILAMRIHLSRDHDQWVGTQTALEMRVQSEREVSQIPVGDTLFIDVEALEEKWLR